MQSTPYAKPPQEITLYLSHPFACGYLSGLQSSSLFVDPHTVINKDLYTLFIGHGFRRSGDHVYRPRCPQCNACTSARIDVKGFVRNRQQKRVWHRNRHLTVSRQNNICTDEQFSLYKKYLQHRHGEGEMVSHSLEQFRQFIGSRWCETELLEFRDQGKLVMVAVTDIVNDGLSAFYTFFDPDYQKHSLGVFAILWQINDAHERGLDWIYLGYWIEQCRKMNYKIQYQPLQLYINNEWVAWQRQELGMTETC